MIRKVQDQQYYLSKSEENKDTSKKYHFLALDREQQITASILDDKESRRNQKLGKYTITSKLLGYRQEKNI